MKKLFISLISICALAACNKNQPDTIKVTVFSSNTIDTFTLTDNGITYIDTQSVVDGKGADIGIQIGVVSSYITFQTSANGRFPFVLNIQTGPGPTGAVGVYKESPADSTYDEDVFVEAFNGGEAYTVDSIIVTTTTVTPHTVICSYQVWLSNAAGSKFVSGTIKSNHAIIQ